MRIGFFTDSYSPYMSGVVKSIDSFRSELIKTGNEVYIFAPDYPDSDKREDVFRFKSLPAVTNPGFRLALPLSNKILQKVQELRLDIIHTHSPFLMGWLGRFVARRLDLPLVFTYHTLYEEYAHYAPLARGLARKLAIKYSRDFCQACDLVIAPSDYVKKRLNNYGVKSLVKTISTGIDLAPYQQNSANRVREEYGIRENEKILLFVGRLGQEKNVTFLLNSYQKVSESLNGIRLILVGDGPEREKLEEMAREFSLRDEIIFAGRQQPEKVVDFYLASDLFVFPSTTETQGLVTLEAMAAGLPVVAVDAAGSSAMVSDGLDGLLVKPDINLFSRGIIELLTHDLRYNLFQKNALEKAEDFAIEKTAERLVSSYKEVLIKDEYKQHLA